MTAYSAERAVVDGIDIIRLKDPGRNVEVSIVPSIGNNAYEMKVNGKDVFWSPYRTLKELAEQPAQAGNPFLAPWANRIDGEAYWANGKKYLLNPDLRNYKYDAFHHPIHGLLTFAKDWKVVTQWADEKCAVSTSRLDFWTRPDWMAQFPFAHSIEITHRLRNGVLEVDTAIQNLSKDPMPLSLGFHTYYRIDDSPRDEWQVHIPAKEQVVASGEMLPTGERKSPALAGPQPLKDFQLDDGFTNLERDEHGRALFYVQGKRQRINVAFGPKYNVAVVYAPPGRDFVCFEPMVGVTNAFNLAHAGIYKEMQYIQAGGTWRESFWVKPEGY